MSTRLIGRFYFKKTAGGNLIGEYSNRDPSAKRSYAEAATRTTNGNSWIGHYTTTWCEAPDNPGLSAHLEITEKADCFGIFSLCWTSIAEPKGKVLFRGEAMLCDDLLVGDYSEK